MSGVLFDTNVWLATVFQSHPNHAAAQNALGAATAAAPAVFCRSTQQSFLRLMSTPTVLRAYGAESLTNRDALAALDALQSLRQVRVSDEPPGVFDRWRRLAVLDTASPKVWMDAYLAAFAVAGGLRFATFDSGFRSFVARGLSLELMKS